MPVLFEGGLWSAKRDGIFHNKRKKGPDGIFRKLDAMHSVELKPGVTQIPQRVGFLKSWLLGDKIAFLMFFCFGFLFLYRFVRWYAFVAFRAIIFPDLIYIMHPCVSGSLHV